MFYGKLKNEKEISVSERFMGGDAAIRKRHEKKEEKQITAGG